MSDGYRWELGDGELFDSYAEAEEAALYERSCASFGAEILHNHNPGDYSEEVDELDYEIVEA